MPLSLWRKRLTGNLEYCTETQLRSNSSESVAWSVAWLGSWVVFGWSDACLGYAISLLKYLHLATRSVALNELMLITFCRIQAQSQISAGTLTLNVTRCTVHVARCWLLPFARRPVLDARYRRFAHSSSGRHNYTNCNCNCN